MKKRILEMLICPRCLPEEHDLRPHIKAEKKGDILEGFLSCAHCNKEYPIQNGIAFLDSDSPQMRQAAPSKYEEAPVLSSYMWSHYGDLLREENVSTAYSPRGVVLGRIGFASQSQQPHR